jgi:uncharacterized protein YkwD
MEGMTAAHNAVRCAVDASPPIPPLAWSSTVAATAQAYAEQLAANGCNLTHSGSGYGENLAVGGSPQGVVDGWAAEIGNFSYVVFPDSCSGVCGHYTQIIWRDSSALGCGSAPCAGGGSVFVCNYDPPGNFIGQMPY